MCLIGAGINLNRTGTLFPSMRLICLPCPPGSISDGIECKKCPPGSSQVSIKNICIYYQKLYKIKKLILKWK